MKTHFFRMISLLLLTGLLADATLAVALSQPSTLEKRMTPYSCFAEQALGARVREMLQIIHSDKPTDRNGLQSLFQNTQYAEPSQADRETFIDPISLNPEIRELKQMNAELGEKEFDSKFSAILTSDQRSIFKDNRRQLHRLYASGHITFDAGLLPYADFIMDRVAFEMTFLVPRHIPATIKMHWNVIEEELGVMDYVGPYEYVCGVRSTIIPSAAGSWVKFDQTVAAESLHVAQHLWRDVIGKPSGLKHFGLFPDQLFSFFEAGEHLMAKLYSKMENADARHYEKLFRVPSENLPETHARGRRLSDRAWENIEAWSAQDPSMRLELTRAYAQLFSLTIPRQDMSPWEFELRHAFNLAFLVHMDIDYFKFADDDPVERWSQLLKAIHELDRLANIKVFIPIFLENGFDFRPFITLLESTFVEIKTIGSEEAQRRSDRMSLIVAQIESLRPIREAIEQARAHDIEKAIFGIRSPQVLLAQAA